MKSTNSPDAKNRKRKLALFNLEGHLKSYNSGLNPEGKEIKDKEYCAAQVERVTKEIAILKSRIVN